MSSIDSEYIRKHPKSAEIFEKSALMFPDGVTHDTRFLTPFPIYVSNALGPLKWDHDGFEYVDYVSGHGALLLGHSHPVIVNAVTDQIKKGTHLGANTELEVRWGNAVKNLIPSIEKIRFHSSGTEATMMAMRLARAYTGKNKIVKFQDHFHGWHDYALAGSDGGTGGIPKSTWDSMIVLPAGDMDALEDTLSKDKDIAAIITEPTGAHMGQNPLQVPEYLEKIREITELYGIVFILDEVVTGFRLSRGGAQERFNIKPDLTTMAKILAGGLPGGAVGGKAEIVDMIQHRGEPEWDNQKRVSHNGTFNANPLCAIAGSICLELIAKEPINEMADLMANKLRYGLNETLIKMEVPGVAYGISSLVLLSFGVESNPQEVWKIPHDTLNSAAKPGTRQAFKRAMINEGIDTMGGRGFIVSAVHTENEIDRTIEAFEKTLVNMRQDGIV